jgi:hypothetical protein
MFYEVTWIMLPLALAMAAATAFPTNEKKKGSVINAGLDAFFCE